MRLPLRPLGHLAAAIAVSGCSPFPVTATYLTDVAAYRLDGEPLGAARMVGPDGASIIGPNGGTLVGPDRGTLAAPPVVPPAASRAGELYGRLVAPAGIVAAGAGNLIGVDAGTILSHNGSALVAAGGGNLAARGLMAAGARGLQGAVVMAVFEDGSPLVGVAPVRTDATGGFRLQGVPVGATVVVTARVATASGATRVFEAIARVADDRGETELSVASTLVTMAARRGGPLASLGRDDYAAAMAAAHATLDEGQVAAIAEAGAWDAAADDLLAASPAVRAAAEARRPAMKVDVEARTAGGPAARPPGTTGESGTTGEPDAAGGEPAGGGNVNSASAGGAPKPRRRHNGNGRRARPRAEAVPETSSAKEIATGDPVATSPSPSDDATSGAGRPGQAESPNQAGSPNGDGGDGGAHGQGSSGEHGGGQGQSGATGQTEQGAGASGTAHDHGSADAGESHGHSGENAGDD